MKETANDRTFRTPETPFWYDVLRNYPIIHYIESKQISNVISLE